MELKFLIFLFNTLCICRLYWAKIFIQATLMSLVIYFLYNKVIMGFGLSL